jgi:hypothetical protein
VSSNQYTSTTSSLNFVAYFTILLVARPIYLSIYLRLYSPCEPWLFCSFLIHIHSIGLFGRGISPPQGRYLHTEQEKRRINAHTYIHASSEIRTYGPSFRASEDNSCLRQRGYRDRLASERAKTIHALERAATVIGGETYIAPNGRSIDER